MIPENELPPLPDAAGWALNYEGGVYTAEQVRAYAREVERVAYERAAREVDQPYSGEQDDITREAMDRAANRIRALAKD